MAWQLESVPLGQARKPRKPREKVIIGWRELVGLPDLGIETMRAKIDTGARTSALHATRMETFEQGGRPWVRFQPPAFGRAGRDPVTAAIVDERDIKNTSGIPERRLIIETTLRMGDGTWRVEVSLTDRKRMGFDLILGRTALRRHGILIEPGQSYRLGKPR